MSNLPEPPAPPAYNRQPIEPTELTIPAAPQDRRDPIPDRSDLVPSFRCNMNENYREVTVVDLILAAWQGYEGQKRLRDTESAKVALKVFEKIENLNAEHPRKPAFEIIGMMIIWTTARDGGGKYKRGKSLHRAALFVLLKQAKYTARRWTDIGA